MLVKGATGLDELIKHHRMFTISVSAGHHQYTKVAPGLNAVFPNDARSERGWLFTRFSFNQTSKHKCMMVYNSYGQIMYWDITDLVLDYEDCLEYSCGEISERTGKRSPFIYYVFILLLLALFRGKCASQIPSNL